MRCEVMLKYIPDHSMFSVNGFEYSYLAVFWLGPPVNAVWFVHKVAGKRAHDAAVAGNEDIFIILLLQFLKERMASFYKGGESFNCFGCREQFRH